MSKKLFYRQLPLNGKVTKVKTVFNTVSGSRRQRPALTVNRHGHVKSNVEACEEFRAYVAEQGFDANQPSITTSTNDALGLILVYAASATEEGAIEVKVNADGTFTTHFGAALEQSPDLRPVTTVLARYEPSLDQEGRPCLAVQIKAAGPKRRGAADPEKLAARAEEEAAKAEAKAAAKKRIAAAREGRGKGKNSGGGASDGGPSAE